MRVRSSLAVAVVFASAFVAKSAAADPAATNPNTVSEKDPPTKAPTFTPPDTPYRYQQPYPYLTPAWLLTQLIPSPEVAIGSDATGETKTSFGIRWQLTPALWSWGVHRRLSGWRFFVVDPLARMSGSIALEQTFEYVGGHVDRVLARPGVKATFPLLHRGEYLAFSMGTSVYTYESNQFVAHGVGLYVLWGTLGLEYTYAPAHSLMTSLVTLRIRSF